MELCALSINAENPLPSRHTMGSSTAVEEQQEEEEEYALVGFP